MHFVYWSVYNAREAWRHAELLGAAATAVAVRHTKRSEPESERGGSLCQQNKIWNAAVLTEEDRGKERILHFKSFIERARDGAQAAGDLFIYFLTCCNKNGSRHHRPMKGILPVFSHSYTTSHTRSHRSFHSRYTHKMNPHSTWEKSCPVFFSVAYGLP